MLKIMSGYIQCLGNMFWINHSPTNRGDEEVNCWTMY